MVHPMTSASCPSAPAISAVPSAPPPASPWRARATPGSSRSERPRDAPHRRRCALRSSPTGEPAPTLAVFRHGGQSVQLARAVPEPRFETSTIRPRERKPYRDSALSIFRRSARALPPSGEERGYLFSCYMAVRSSPATSLSLILPTFFSSYFFLFFFLFFPFLFFQIFLFLVFFSSVRLIFFSFVFISEFARSVSVRDRLARPPGLC